MRGVGNNAATARTGRVSGQGTSCAKSPVSFVTLCCGRFTIFVGVTTGDIAVLRTYADGRARTFWETCDEVSGPRDGVGDCHCALDRFRCRRRRERNHQISCIRCCHRGRDRQYVPTWTPSVTVSCNYVE